MELNLKLVACEKPHLPSHGVEIFSCTGRGRLGSAVRVPCLKKILTSVIYDQFFCYFPISQTVELFCKKSDTEYKFYYHCHCMSPNSLQCRAARAVLLSCFNNVSITLFSERNIRTVSICCNTWICCPLIFLGAFKMLDSHFFFLFSGIVEEEFKLKWFSYQNVRCISISENTCLVAIKCNCGLSLKKCFSLFEQRFNFIRMLYCCSLVYRVLPEPGWIV
ncbi:E4.2 [Bovine adenovirus 7]|nr:E4.2 [Bovine adenovirus 7]